MSEITACPNPREPRWRRLPEERPQQIIEAAFEVFGERGLAKARLDDIAKRAGVSKGTIYLYFPDKDALFVEMVRRIVITRIERAELVLEHGTASEQLQAFLAALWESLRSPVFTTLYRLIISELPQFPHLSQFYVREVALRVLRLGAEIIRRGTAAGEFREVEPMTAARIVQSMLVKHAIWCADREGFAQLCEIPDDEVLAQLTDFVFHALRPAPGTTGAGASA